MNTGVRDLVSGLIYIFLALLQVAESIFPWVRYCKIEFSFLSVFIVDDGLLGKHSRISSYSYLSETLCRDFKPIAESACPEFCTNTENLQNSGLLMFSCNMVCIILSLFLAYHYISKHYKRFEGRIPPVALWTLTIIKVFLGVIYLQMIDPSTILTTWEAEYDIRLSFGFYFYALGVFSQIVVSYWLYNVENMQLRAPTELKLSS